MKKIGRIRFVMGRSVTLALKYNLIKYKLILLDLPDLGKVYCMKKNLRFKDNY